MSDLPQTLTRCQITLFFFSKPKYVSYLYLYFMFIPIFCSHCVSDLRLYNWTSIYSYCKTRYILIIVCFMHMLYFLQCLYSHCLFYAHVIFSPMFVVTLKYKSCMVSWHTYTCTWMILYLYSVLLTPICIYKLKLPLRFEFINFTLVD